MRKGHEKRMRVWRHNALLGTAKLSLNFLANVQKIDSTTDEAKKLAREAEIFMEFLAKELKNRVDP